MHLRIGIKKKKQTTNCIFFMILFVIFERILESFGVPHSVIFLLDIANVYLFMNLCVGHKVQWIFSTGFVKTHIFIFTVGFVVALLNGVSLQLIIWAMRNLLRFYVFFGACVAYLNGKDVDDFYELLAKLFYFNVVILLVQYMMGYRGDFLGGLFGTATGANTYNNVLQIIVCTYFVSRWFEKREGAKQPILIIILSLFISVLTETKVFLFEVVLIIGLSVVMIGIVERKYKVLAKGVLIGGLAVLGVFFGARYIATLYPSLSNSDFMSVEGLTYILTRESGYTGFGDLNRLTAITSINRLGLFQSSLSNQILGLGLGGAEYSAGISFLQSAFYRSYEYLHYYWFSHAWMYIECGYLGLIGYMLGFFSIVPTGVKIVRMLKKRGLDASVVVTGMVISILTLLLYIYNQTLRLEAAYLIYFVFAGIYVKGKELKING